MSKSLGALDWAGWAAGLGWTVPSLALSQPRGGGSNLFVQEADTSASLAQDDVAMPACDNDDDYSFNQSVVGGFGASEQWVERRRRMWRWRANREWEWTIDRQILEVR
ncbi:hypothetical protein B0T22DRAFT_443723 [Podospora appendiculata]|uniref:Uncharacterized protein n=1 Tax=Podospora appendiculata TaxID=314037 RepID=A0AAE1C914_9PEZI|nr:hypothetical protein B0T22DRAFT_443723 [Podospora appendiculata]